MRCSPPETEAGFYESLLQRQPALVCFVANGFAASPVGNAVNG
jgi:hypothetical protein